MPTFAVAALVVLGVLALVVLSIALVAVTDRLRATVDGLVGVRDRVQPSLAELTSATERARRHGERLRRARLRPGLPAPVPRPPAAPTPDGERQTP